MTTERDSEHSGDPVVDLDPGAYIGHEPERESESIPGGVTDRDERTSAHDSQPGVPGEPDADGDDTDKDLVRGGSGEEGRPHDPSTNDDLMSGGSGSSEAEPRKGLDD